MKLTKIFIPFQVCLKQNKAANLGNCDPRIITEKYSFNQNKFKPSDKEEEDLEKEEDYERKY